MIEPDPDVLSDIQVANSYRIGNCDNPECRAFHIILLDEDDEPFAACSIPFDNIVSLMEKMRDHVHEQRNRGPEVDGHA